jgi:PTS system nitrogen regulatory IIA component
MQEDFDLDSLAKYLHLTPAQVARMADRGRMPGRKIAGQWRFSQAEIHHWLEEQIGASDDEELVRVEQVLEHPQGSFAEQISLASLIPARGIQMALSARARRSVIAAMVQLASDAGVLWDTAKMERAVVEREDLHPTALDIGVALLHPRRPLPSILAEPALLLGKTTQGIPFGGSKGRLTDMFFLICSMDDRGHLRVLARLSRLIGDERFLTGLRQCEDEASARAWISEKEIELFA